MTEEKKKDMEIDPDEKKEEKNTDVRDTEEGTGSCEGDGTAGQDEESKEGSDGGSEDAAGSTESKEEDEALELKYMRLMADFQNYKRRVEKEKSNIYAYANEEIVNDLLDVLDNFERALEHETDDISFKEGMDMIFGQLKDVLTGSGVEEIKAVGEVFDPNFHNAVMTEDTEEVESGKVSEVLQKGYILKGKVIRPAMVKVAN